MLVRPCIHESREGEIYRIMGGGSVRRIQTSPRVTVTTDGGWNGVWFERMEFMPAPSLTEK